MYINITKDLVQIALGKDDASEKARDVLDKLNDAVKYGMHFIRAKCDALNVLQSSNKWPYLQSLSRYLSIRPPYKWRVEFIPGQSIRDDVDKICYISLLSSPNDFSFIFSKTKLLTENSTDAVIYEYILDYYKSHNGLVNDNYYECVSGGGNTIGEEFEKYCKSYNAFCLCLADSDKHYPDANIGNTALGVKVVHEKKYPCGLGYNLDTLEIENLLPQQLYYQYYDKFLRAEMYRYNQIQSIARSHESYLQFIDLKLGISLYNLLNMDNRDNALEIVRSIIPDINQVVSCDRTVIIEENAQKLHKYVEGYGVGILKNIEKKLSVGDLSLESCDWNSMTQFQRGEYEFIGSLINDWTCRSDRVRL